MDFERLYVFALCPAFFVRRTKENVLLQRRYSVMRHGLFPWDSHDLFQRVSHNHLH